MQVTRIDTASIVVALPQPAQEHSTMVLLTPFIFFLFFPLGYSIVKTKEGKEIFTTAASDKEWTDARAGYIDKACLNMPEYTKVLNDPKLNNPFGRIDNLEKLFEIVTYAASKTTYQQFQQAKGVLCGAVNTRDSMLQDPHIVQGNYLTEVKHPQMGRQRQPTTPVLFSQTKTSIRRAASLLDEDRDIVLEMLSKK